MLTVTRHCRGRSTIELSGNLSAAKGRASFTNIAAALRTGKVSLYGGELTTAATLAEKLEELGNPETIDLFVNLADCDPLEALACYSLLQRHSAKITATIDGICGGAALAIPMAANKINIAEAAHIRLDTSQAVTFGDTYMQREVANILKKLDGGFASLFARRSGRHSDSMLTKMKARTWLDASEAKAMGLVDRVIPLNRGAENVAAKIRQLDIDEDREVEQMVRSARQRVAARSR
jgi:ATP-dependent Clp protease, protease subunit